MWRSLLATRSLTQPVLSILYVAESMVGVALVLNARVALGRAA